MNIPNYNEPLFQTSFTGNSRTNTQPLNNENPINVQFQNMNSSPSSQNNSINLQINPQVLTIMRDYNANIIQYQMTMNMYNQTMRELIRNVYSPPSSASAALAASVASAQQQTEEELTNALYNDIFRILFRNSMTGGTGTSGGGAAAATENQNIERYYTECMYEVAIDGSGIEIIRYVNENGIDVRGIRNETNTCPITMDEFQNGEIVCKLNCCGHTFCREPLKRWLRNHDTCPVCRAYVTQINVYN